MIPDIDFGLCYEYLNAGDAANAMAAHKRWVEKEEARQEEQFGRLIRRMLANVGIRRVFLWL